MTFWHFYRPQLDGFVLLSSIGPRMEVQAMMWRGRPIRPVKLIPDVPLRLPEIRARQITEDDLEAVVNLLTRGFELRSRRYWQRAMTKLKSHPSPGGFPSFGHLLECDGTLVGVILQIFSAVPTTNGWQTRCNLSSWYIEPEFRIYASMLISQAIKYRNVTYVNISPAKHTWPIVEAQGFSRYSNGQFVCVPALNMTCADSGAQVIAVDAAPDLHCDSSERELLLIHKTLGCLSLWCKTSSGAHPFAFMPRLVKGVMPCTQLIYCRDIQDFVQFAWPIGRYLTARGRPLVIIDSNGPIPGLVGKYFNNKAPKYFKGPDPPGFGDLAYTEAVMFGL